MPLVLNPQVEAQIQRRIEIGPYRSASDVVREALRLMDERDRADRLRSPILAGHEEAERGEVVDLTPELMEEIIRESDEMDERGDSPDRDVCP